MTSQSRFTYMDHAATTAVDPRVLEAMLPYLSGSFGNPSSAYRLAAEARSAVESARVTVAEALGASPSEIFFTSCGSESDNLALRGVAFANRDRGNHIITSPIEHHAILHTCEQLAQEFGAKITYLPIDRSGMADPDNVARAITDKTTLISLMYGNNEVGTIQSIEEIGKIARAKNIPFHTDAVQAAGSLDLDVNLLNVDLMSLSGHKFYAPKGIGVLYMREGTRILPMQTGGLQERGLRAGTENVAFIVGLAVALRLAREQQESENERLAKLRELLIKGITTSISQAHLTGHPTQRLVNNASFVFSDINGAEIVLKLDQVGVASSSGSACTTCDPKPSHVLLAMGYDPALAVGSLRLTLGKDSTLQDVNYVLSVLPGIVSKLRSGTSVMDQEKEKMLVTESAIPSQQDDVLPLGANTPMVNSFLSSESTVVPSRADSMTSSTEVRTVDASEQDSRGPQLVYVLGMLGYDFGTEARRDAYAQSMGHKNPEIKSDFLAHLEKYPHEAADVIWTLNLEETPVYAIVPSGSFAELTYGRLREFLSGQTTEKVERVSIAGIITGSVRLFSGQVVPLIVPELRGMSSWSTSALIRAVLGAPPPPRAKEKRVQYEQQRDDLRNFLERVYYELMNMGRTAAQRAMNFAATNAFQVADVFRDAAKANLMLDRIGAEPSPVCRPNSDCWDVKLTFFDPANRLTVARKMYRFTVDVSDVVPVTVGTVRSWAVY